MTYCNSTIAETGCRLIMFPHKRSLPCQNSHTFYFTFRSHQLWAHLVPCLHQTSSNGRGPTAVLSVIMYQRFSHQAIDFSLKWTYHLIIITLFVNIYTAINSAFIHPHRYTPLLFSGVYNFVTRFKNLSVPLSAFISKTSLCSKSRNTLSRHQLLSSVTALQFI